MTFDSWMEEMKRGILSPNEENQKDLSKLNDLMDEDCEEE